jgi:hypothetical protein
VKTRRPLFLDAYFRRAGTPYTDRELMDAVNAVGVRGVFITMMPGRCGSTRIASLCADYGFGTGREEFKEQLEAGFRVDPHIGSAPDYFRRTVARNTLNGRFYIQITPNRLERLMCFASAESLRAMGTGFSLIFRRDIFAQALSYYNALRTGVWHVHGSDPVDGGPDLDLPQIGRRIRLILDLETRAFALASSIGIRPAVTLYYEDIAADPLASMVRFLRACGEPVDLARLQAAIASDRSVSKIQRPESAGQYLRMSRELPGFDALLEARLAAPHHPDTYRLFADHGY